MTAHPASNQKSPIDGGETTAQTVINPGDAPSATNPHDSVIVLSPKQRLVRSVRTARLPVMLTGVVIISLLLTSVSVWLYSSTGANRLDLSRPGFERERTEVRESEPRRAYDTTSPVTQQTIDEFLSEYDDRVNEVNGYTGFSNQDAVSDETLKLSTPN